MVAVDKLADNFLLFVDPVMKGMYQVDLHRTLTSSGPQPVHGIDIRTSTMPERGAFDLTTQHFYWHDNEFDGQNVIKRMSLAGDVAERALTVLSDGIDNSLVAYFMHGTLRICNFLLCGCILLTRCYRP